MGASLSVKLEPGSLFLSIAGSVGKPCITQIKCCIHDGFVYFPNSSLEPRFLHRIFEAGEAYEGLGKLGTQLNLNTDTVGWIQVPMPNQDEQRAIADFLDRKTKAIDDLIQKKERLIELLQEKRQALITQVVTKGLDPTVPMQDSGIEWLGEIPAHWHTHLLKYVCVLQRGFDLPAQDRREGNVPIYGGGGITGYHDIAMVEPPGVVTGRYGTVGDVYLVGEPFWPLNTSLYVKEFWGNYPAFVYYLLETVPVKAYSAKSAVPGVDRNDLHVIPVVVPPPAAQRVIAYKLAEIEAAFNRLSQKIQNQMAKLREYRQALISAAVTGKIDVTKETAC